MLLIVKYFTKAMQGYYYAFMPILGAQTFFELSMHVVIINSASHEWASLSTNDKGHVTGDAVALSRLAGLVRFVTKWYSVVAVAFMIVIGWVGVSILSTQSLDQSQWLGPWIVTVIATGLLLLTLPFQATLEGCGQLATVNRYRLAQAFTGTIIVITCIAFGMGLWAIAASAMARLLWEVALVFGRYRPFFRSLFSVAATSNLEWLKESWSFMWRLAVQGVTGYFAMQLVTLVIFAYHGDEAGGQFGMTWQILLALQAGAFSWVETRRPMFGNMIAEKNYTALDEVWLRLSSISFGIQVVTSAGFIVALAVLHSLDWSIAAKITDRMLPVLPTVLIALALVALHIPRCQNIYIRAHKRDPYLVPGLAINTLMGLMVLYLGKTHGAMGVAVTYLVVIGLIQLPVWWIVWHRCRIAWHAESTKG